MHPLTQIRPIFVEEADVTTPHVADGVAVDYDRDGQLAGVEILDAVRRFGGREALRQVVLEGVGLASA